MKIFIRINLLLILALITASCSLNAPENIDELEDIRIPHNPTPKDKEILTSHALSLKWESEDAEEYYVYFGKDEATNLFYKTVKIPRVIVTGLKNNSKYYWRVVAKLSDGTEKKSPIWSFTIVPSSAIDEGFIMIKHNLFTDIPNRVNVMFQVIDFANKGVTNLTEKDFIILEDGEPISPTESGLRIRKNNEVAYKMRTILLIDNSTSIGKDLDEVKQAAIAFVDGMKSIDEVALYRFSESAKLLQDFTSDKNLLRSVINGMNIGYPTTDLYGAVKKAAKHLQDKFSSNKIFQSAMIIFTDGTDTQASHSFSDALNAVAGKRCYTVSLGKEIDPYVLESLGTAGFYSINDVAELKKQFTEIQDEVYSFANSFYWLNYNSPKRGNFEHFLTLKIKDNPNQNVNSYIDASFNSVNFFSIMAGVYINSTSSNRKGIDSLLLYPGSSRNLTASSYSLLNEPQYLWSSNNKNVVTVKAKDVPTNYSNAIITANSSANKGDRAIITVKDNNNAPYRKELLIIIK